MSKLLPLYSFKTFLMLLGFSYTLANATGDGNATILKVLETSHKWQSDTIAFYKANDYNYAWFINGQLSKAAQIALDVLKNADQEGLNPNDYQTGEKAFKAFQEQKISAEEFDASLSDVFIRFINDVRVGRVPPTDKSRIIKLKSPKTDPIKLLTDALADKNGTFQQLREMAPPLPDYAKLRKLLAHYRQHLNGETTWPEIKSDKLKVGAKGEDIIRLKQILKALGFYKGDLDSQEFDTSVEEAVKRFQEHHTINPDGVIGSATRKALNLSLSDHINKIIINLERLRWLPDDLGDKHILVNVGGYEVMAVNNNQVELRIKAIVGRPSRQTPLFYAPLKNVIINPSWGVPAGIMANDKLPKIINDPSYVRRSGFTVYDSAGNVVDPDQADWEGNGMSYRLRQSPGAHNALGRIKLNIENPYTIYLHGTPEEKLFKESARAFSSGCIRLQQPAELAAWVLSHSSDWSLDKIQAAIKAGGTKTVPLKDSIPVYFMYMTVWVDDQGKEHFSNDVYNLDPQLIQQLKLNNQVSMADQGMGKHIYG